jgi:signal peptidase I
MKVKRIIVTAGLSLIQPGLGQLVNKEPGKAIAFMAFPWMTLLAARISRLFHNPLGFWLYLAFIVCLIICAVVDAIRSARTYDESSKHDMNRLAFVFAITLAVVNIGLAAFLYNPGKALRVGAYVIASDAMNPTLRVGDRIIVDTAAYSRKPPGRGDVIVFVRDESGETLYPKRVIGLPGDRVEGTDSVKINGQALQERYLAAPDPAMATTAPFGPITIPPNHYFVMGDFRQDSLDSREYGPIDVSQIRGQVLYMYWSRDRTRIGSVVR